jgi:hypothetical protein
MSASSSIVNSPGLPMLTGPGRRCRAARGSRDLVVDVAEAAGLAAVAVDRQRLAAQRLHDEVRHHAPVVDLHARPVGVEDAHDAHVDAVARWYAMVSASENRLASS